MFNARATFNAYLRAAMDAGVPVHLKPSEETAWPSYRIHWLAFNPTTRNGELQALVQVDINVPDDDDATTVQRAERLLRNLGLANYATRPGLQVLDYSDPSQPKPTGLWADYGLQLRRGWTAVPTQDPTKRRLAVTLELSFPNG